MDVDTSNMSSYWNCRKPSKSICFGLPFVAHCIQTHTHTLAWFSNFANSFIAPNSFRDLNQFWSVRLDMQFCCYFFVFVAADVFVVTVGPKCVLYLHVLYCCFTLDGCSKIDWKWLKDGGNLVEILCEPRLASSSIPETLFLIRTQCKQ